MIEVELRSLLSDEEYNRLLIQLPKEATFVSDEEQETHYLDSPVDLRIMKSCNTRIWMKKGKMHDTNREEIEVLFEKDDFDKLLKIFENLGMKTKLTWFRKRKIYKMGEATITLDDTKNYGKILEIEKLCSQEQAANAEGEIRRMFLEFKIKETPKEVFNEKYAEYVQRFSI